MTDSTVGRSVPRPDGERKALGRSEYIDDITLPGMLHAAVVRSPHAHARILGIDAGAARRVPGVVAVVTGADAAELTGGRHPSGRPRTYGMNIEDELVLASERVRYVGDEVAAVLADTAAAAAEAARLVEVEYEVVAAVRDPGGAMAPGAPLVHDDRQRNVAVEHHIEHGDVDAAFASAEVVVSGRFRTPLQHQGYLDHYGCVAGFDGERLTVWAPVQDPFLLRGMLAEVFGLPVGKVRVVQPTIGGSYGGKLRHQKLPFLATLLSLRVGRPVKLVNTRAEEFLSGRPRIAADLTMKLGFAADGRLLAKQTTIVADNGAYTSYAAGPFAVMVMRADNQYRLANIRTDAYLVYTNTVPSGSFRGYGNIQNIFAIESLMDDAARRLRIDPIELRLRNAVTAGDVTAHDWHIQTDGLRRCLAEVRAVTRDWGGQPAPHRGVGIACAIHSSSNRSLPFDGSTCRLTLNLDGTVTLATGEPDLGQGSSMAFAQLAAAVLDLPVEAFAVPAVDTDLSPFGLGPSSDRSTTSGGQAVVGAARQFQQEVLRAAATASGTDPGELTYTAGVVRGASDEGWQMTLAEVAQAAMWRHGGRPVSVEYTFDHPHTEQRDPKTLRGNSHPTHSFSAQAVEVEVDPETGDIRILRMVSAHDLGRAVNPAAARGQVYGAIAHGLGFALHERYLTDAGRVVRGLLEYGLVRATDMPPVEVVLVETDDPRGPLGAKGIGQPGSLLPAPAIANAVADAVGVRLRDLPMTAGSVLKARYDNEEGR